MHSIVLPATAHLNANTAPLGVALEADFPVLVTGQLTGELLGQGHVAVLIRGITVLVRVLNAGSEGLDAHAVSGGCLVSVLKVN